ncbi:hypothetical protein KY343_06920 [Candidatus Woesearchaeota archaeon]|nr:hypothetical protein [Candidatus Woesearchaeota archaeon]
MKCDNCRKESQWLEIIGSEYICHKCIGKNKVLGLILRTHIDTFQFIVRKLKPKDYSDLMKISKEDVEKIADLKEHGIELR